MYRDWELSLHYRKKILMVLNLITRVQRSIQRWRSVRIRAHVAPCVFYFRLWKCKMGINTIAISTIPASISTASNILDAGRMAVAVTDGSVGVAEAPVRIASDG